ncbi:hypothetical protein BYT27DRAFT_7234400 [Phlegmacium glaucopus]|nr:hypothetical protein BYT27DRAFT_7236295 [Phlegmacium glaucopus]KAF8805101.1 hypothetical protein BYT27DRAFT_7234400 [Phlegmacium glaucopus]
MTSTKSAHSSASSSPPTKRVYQILAGQLFDPPRRTLASNQVITVDRDLGIVLDVKSKLEVEASENEYGQNIEIIKIDLSHLVILPGLIDVHLTQESLAERTVRATVHARRTLLAGFTTVRDLGTEGAFDSDIGLRKCLCGRNALIPGPRYYCATRALISTGSYGPKSTLYPAQEGIDGIKGAESVDGVDACVREVRKQIGGGADWIKVDYRCRSRMGDVFPAVGAASIATFNTEELSTIIATAHARGVKVAAHANTSCSIDTLLDPGVDSIEHGSENYDIEDNSKNLLRKLVKANGTTIWVPTLAAYYTTALSGSAESRKTWERCKIIGMENIACGGDIGVFPHGANALELVLMRQLGAPWDNVLSWATYGGWKCVRGMEWEGGEGDRRIRNVTNLPTSDLGWSFGLICPGWAGDLIGIEGKLDGTVEEFERALVDGVKFMMKGGKIHKRDGQEVLGVCCFRNICCV